MEGLWPLAGQCLAGVLGVGAGGKSETQIPTQCCLQRTEGTALSLGGPHSWFSIKVHTRPFINISNAYCAGLGYQVSTVLLSSHGRE